jgi:uncharacterized protein (UPF0335 family)
MAQLIEREPASADLPRSERDKAVKIVAKSVYRELKANGYDARQMVALATELISLVTAEMNAAPHDSDR